MTNYKIQNDFSIEELHQKLHSALEIFKVNDEKIQTTKCLELSLSAMDELTKPVHNVAAIFFNPVNFEIFEKIYGDDCNSGYITYKNSNEIMPSFMNIPIVIDDSIPKDEVYAISLTKSGNIGIAENISKLIIGK